MARKFVPLKSLREHVSANGWSNTMYRDIGVELNISNINLNETIGGKFPKGMVIDTNGRKFPIEHCVLVDEGDEINLSAVPYSEFASKAKKIVSEFAKMYPESSASGTRARKMYDIIRDTVDSLNGYVSAKARQGGNGPSLLDEMVFEDNISDEEIDSRLGQVKRLILVRRQTFNNRLKEALKLDYNHFRSTISLSN